MDTFLLNSKDEKLRQLKAIFPEVFDEGKIDWEKLKATLGEEVNFSNERYVLNWAGKSEAFRVLQQPSTKTLVPAKEESVDFDNTKNIFIEGENLEVLKVLQKSYFGKVKMIYIDPPYNTGNDSFIYPDKFSESKEEYQQRVGDLVGSDELLVGSDKLLVDSDKCEVDSSNHSPLITNHYSLNTNHLVLAKERWGKNSKENGQYHSNWLNMMMPRLYLAKNLLREDGVIFISIDDNEVHNLRLLMNEIFGEENFVECISWNKRVPKNDKGIGNIHEYILIYVKDNSFAHQFLMRKEGLEDVFDFVKKLKQSKMSIPDSEREIKKYYKKQGYDRGITLYNSLDENYRLWGKINMSWPNANTFGPRYEVLHPITKKAVKIPDRGWRWKKETFDESLDYDNIVSLHDGSYLCGKIWFDKDENTQPSSILYLDDVNDLLLRSILSLKSDGGIEVEKLFDEKSYFSYPKPTSLLRTIFGSITSTNNDIILDFFAGSATTAHAVMQLNKEDGGNRQFICVQMPELCDENSEAYKAGYKTIAEISKERIRRAGKSLTPNPSPIGEGNKTKENATPSPLGEGWGEVDMFKGATPDLFSNARTMRIEDKTEAEDVLWQYLRNRQVEGCKFRRQHPVGQFIVDFYCHEKKLAIEVDGGYHNTQEQIERDNERTKVINEYGIQILRFTNEQVLSDTNNVIKQIETALTTSSPLGKGSTFITPSPIGEGRGEVDLGFKVLKLQDSNFKQWRQVKDNNIEEIEKQMEMFIDPVAENATVENMVYELLLKSGKDLNSRIEKIVISDKLLVDSSNHSPLTTNHSYYRINENELILMLESASEQVVASVLANHPQKVIALDRLFEGNDQLKTNTALQMRDRGVEFKTI